ncbi:hypothetical protein D9M70_440570 [compost metagenome]
MVPTDDEGRACTKPCCRYLATYRRPSPGSLGVLVFAPGQRRSEVRRGQNDSLRFIAKMGKRYLGVTSPLRDPVRCADAAHQKLWLHQHHNHCLTRSPSRQMQQSLQTRRTDQAMRSADRYHCAIPKHQFTAANFRTIRPPRVNVNHQSCSPIRKHSGSS